MKKFITFLLSLSVVVYWSGASVYAQGKGTGRSSLPTASQGHGQSSSRGPVKTNSNQSGEHSKGPTKTTWETQLSERFKSDLKFQTRMENLLPDGMSLETAQSGFKNKGQFIAALHVSQNLGISFALLKEKMTGIPATPTTTSTTTPTTTSTTETNSSPMSMGKAIQELKPTLTTTQVTVEVKKAEEQATATENPTS
jgi:hypothetical protein